MIDSGRLAILIGGGEDKAGECVVLAAVSRAVRSRRPGGRLVIVTAASRIPEERYQRYESAFARLGGPTLAHLHLSERSEASADALGDPGDPPAGVFFSGGNQNVLADLLLDTPLHARLRELYGSGVVIAGTSAGASVLGSPMPGPPERREGDRARVGVRTAEGLAILPNLIVDQHFSERDRRRRLLLATADRPGVRGLGVDEDTAVLIEDDARCTVLGRGTVSLCANVTGDIDDAEVIARTTAVYRAGDAFALADAKTMSS